MKNRIRDGGKLPGKTEYSGRRRISSRLSGFKSHPDASGREFRRERVSASPIYAGEVVTIRFDIASVESGEWVGYGGWFWYQGDVEVKIVGGRDHQTLTDYGQEVWNKLGSLWQQEQCCPSSIEVEFHAVVDSRLALYGMDAGHVYHDYLDAARVTILGNMHRYSPEAHFYVGGESADVTSDLADSEGDSAELVIKSCNRCARYLPINVNPNERLPLSFSNHCKAPQLLPCKHSTFSDLRGEEGDELRLVYGYQLECRFCKKFAVNAALNPQRNAAQMKEDGARRRSIESLLGELYQSSPQLRYRHETGGRELADDIWNRFGRHCFNCSAKLLTVRDMHLDHTRPLAKLWPLDSTATALCGRCNSEKRDRSPVEFYSKAQLIALTKITGIPYDELVDPAPNVEALTFLVERIDWFFEQFLTRPEMVTVRDGKVVGELVVKAIQKVIGAAGDGEWPNLETEYERRRPGKRSR